MQDVIHDFLTKKQVCEVLQISPRTLDLWRSRDGLPTVKIGNVCRFKREVVLEWFMKFQRRRELA
jgi:excisionase family DNA binding protein